MTEQKQISAGWPPEPSDIVAHFDAFRAAHPEVTRLDAMIVDMNGLLRGKWLDIDAASKFAKGGVKLPVSTSALDMWGHDVSGSGLGIISGDKDGVLRPILSSLSVVPWARRGTAQILMALDDTDGGPSPFDPRHRLAALLERFGELGLTPVVATELEFFLFKTEAGRPMPLVDGSHLYDMDQMEAFEEVLEGIKEGCAALGLGADTVLAESGIGQYEINFHHQPDALRAADVAVLFKRLVRGVARSHGFDATFMAKPYGDDAGSGMHVHASILDENGDNIFAAATGFETLSHAMGGMLTSMAELQLIFAPTQNAYRRFSREGFAPTQINWGFDHRAAALRVPEREGPAARFEHRVCGADVNPYLAIAAILGGALKGLEGKIDPGASMDADPDSSFGNLDWDFQRCVDRFAASDLAKDIFGPEFVRVYALVKKDEIRQLNAQISDIEYKTYMGRI